MHEGLAGSESSPDVDAVVVAGSLLELMPERMQADVVNASSIRSVSEPLSSGLFTSGKARRTSLLCAKSSSSCQEVPKW